MKTVTKIKISLEDLHSRFDDAKERIRKPEDKYIEIIQSEEQKEKIKKNEQSLRDMWSILRHTSIHTM